MSEEEEEDFSGEEEDDDEDEEEEEEVEKKQLPQRLTRGRRTQNAEEDEGDQEFWNQEAWKEQEDDDEIQSDEYSSNAFGDSSDSDIDQDEREEQLQEQAEQEQEAAGGARKRQKEEDDNPFETRKKGYKYVDPALIKQKGAIRTKKPAPPVTPSERSMRDSTKAITSSTSKALDESRQKSQKRKEGSGRVSGPRNKLMTHKDVLLSACKTEVLNQRALEKMMVIQEEKKREREAANQTNKADPGPRIMFKSNPVGDRLYYSDPAYLPTPKVLPPQPTNLECPVTKLPARYRMSGVGNYLQPFHNLAAYRQLKEQQQTPAPVAAASLPAAQTTFFALSKQVSGSS